MEHPEAHDKPCSCRTVHELYIAAFLLAVISILWAVQWYRIEKLVDLISFAATLSSLLLAVIAIGYAIYSNGGMERGVSTLLSSLDTLRTAASQIDSTREVLAKEIRQLAVITGDLDQKIASTQLDVRAIAERIPTALAAVQAQESNTPEAPVHGGETIPFSPENVLGATSLSGMAALLAAARCHELGNGVDLALLLRGLPFNPEFAQGYLGALSACGLISYEIKRTKIESVKETRWSAEEVRATYIRSLEERFKGKPLYASFLNDLQTLDGRLLGTSPMPEEVKVAEGPVPVATKTE